jgi:mannose-1-phosphate guanylyltransferase
MSEHYYAMIMAGGGGTRLWPMSRSHTPKQLLPLVEDRSMFAVSVERLAPLFTPDRIYVVTGRKYAEALQAQAPDIPAQNFIIEPYGKDSGPAAALGMAVIKKRDPQAVVAILASDHHISDKEGFRNALAVAHEQALQGTIVTLGIMPNFPSTAFGYIQRGETLNKVGGLEICRAVSFKEKPDVNRAIEFIASGDYSWNSGMFIWHVDTAMGEFQRQRPEMYARLTELIPAIDTPAYEETLKRVWEQIDKIALDYAVMEGARSMAVIPVSIGWSDVGSWGSLFEMVELDNDGNSFRGQMPSYIAIDTKNALVYANKLTVVIGMEDIIVVDTDDALMICHKDRTQQVKDVVNRLKVDKLDAFL